MPEKPTPDVATQQETTVERVIPAKKPLKAKKRTGKLRASDTRGVSEALNTMVDAAPNDRMLQRGDAVTKGAMGASDDKHGERAL